MRARYLLFLGVFISSVSFSQIPNGGFENWVTDPDTNMNPVGWETTNSYPIVNVERYSPGHSGNYALKVKTVSAGFLLPGVAILHTPYPFSLRPTKFSAWVKSTIMPGDQTFLLLALMRGDSIIASVANCTFRIDTTFGQFTYREFQIAYQSNLVPDSVFIMVAAGLGSGQVGTELIVDDLAFIGGSPTDVIEKRDLPVAFMLAQNYPNPFNPSTRIEYALPAQSQVSMRIHNLLGEEVATLVDGPVGAGVHAAQWNASGMASGVYFCRITATGMNGSGSFTATRKLVLVK